jgi:hypothetical protein
VAVAAGAGAGENALVDLRPVDLRHGLAHVATVADGQTRPVVIGGLEARRNEDPADDHYMYFDVDDGLLSGARPPEVHVLFHYFDVPGVSLRLQYDGALAAYQDTAAFSTAGTHTWKVHTVVLRDAAFRNRQNGGADFRIAALPGSTFYVDLVYVRVPAARLPAVRISPAQHRDVRPGPWRDVCSRWSEWSNARARADMIGSADHILHSIDGADLFDCFQRINDSHLELSVDAPVLKETAECPSGHACFHAHVGLWDRLAGLGARISSFYMDEPFLASRIHPEQLPYDDAQAVSEVVAWMRLVRERHPHAQIIQVEPYPALSVADLTWWLRALHAACAAQGVPVLDFFVLDHDWTAPGWTFPGIREIQAQSRALGVPFGVLFWAANQKTSTRDADWRRGLMRQGLKYQRAGIVPDLYDINDFMAIPVATVPDTDRSSYTYSVKLFVGRYVRRP